MLAGDAIERAAFTVTVVAWTTLLGGIALLLLDLWLRRRSHVTTGTVGWRHALWVGIVQCLALLPGTSRSGATIAGGLLAGLSRPAAAEFSFLVGLPILYGAGLLKLWRMREEVPAQWSPLLVALLTAFASAALVVGPFVRFLQRHSFVPFAIYRILLGLGLLLWLHNGG